MTGHHLGVVMCNVFTLSLCATATLCLSVRYFRLQNFNLTRSFVEPFFCLWFNITNIAIASNRPPYCGIILIQEKIVLTVGNIDAKSHTSNQTKSMNICYPTFVLRTKNKKNFWTIVQVRLEFWLVLFLTAKWPHLSLRGWTTSSMFFHNLSE